MLVFIQSVLPVPAGLGPVELGFAAWCAGTLRGAEVARLLVVWRFYGVVLGALAGAVLLARMRPRAGLQARAEMQQQDHQRQ